MGATGTTPLRRRSAIYSGYTCNACHQVNTTSTPVGQLRPRAQPHQLDAPTARAAPHATPRTHRRAGRHRPPLRATARTVPATSPPRLALRTPHRQRSMLHRLSPPTRLCKTCHVGADEVVHNNSITYNNGPVTNCLTCHGRRSTRPQTHAPVLVTCVVVRRRHERPHRAEPCEPRCVGDGCFDLVDQHWWIRLFDLPLHGQRRDDLLAQHL